MNYLQMVQKTVRKSGAKIDAPTTVVGQTGLSFLFVEWVQEAWKEIQLERLGYAFRKSRDLTLSLSAGTDEYAMPSGLEAINTRSLTRHLSNENEGVVTFMTYDFWRRWKDRVDVDEGPPTYFTISEVDDKIIFWPTPDENYTIRFEGILEVQEFDYTDAGGANSSNALTPTNLKDPYHDAIVWQAVMKYAKHFEDGSKMAEARSEFLPYKKYFEERFSDIPTVYTGALYEDYYYYREK